VIYRRPTRELSSDRVHLQANSITDLGAKSLFHSLALNRTLTSLNLAVRWVFNISRRTLCCLAHDPRSVVCFVAMKGNCLGDDVVAAIAVMLRANVLMQLELQSNAIGSRGAEGLVAALRTNTSLTHLNLHNNPLGADGGGRIFLDSLPHIQLLELDLSVCRQPARPPRDQISLTQTQRCGYWQSTGITSDCNAALQYAIRHSVCLQRLNLSVRNELQEELPPWLAN